MTNTIVVGFDDSPAAAQALLWAVENAEHRSDNLRVIHVWQPESLDGVGSSNLDWGELEADARADVSDAFDEVSSQYGLPHGLQLEVVRGVPGPFLVDAAREAGLLVVGARVHTKLNRVLHGSVSHHCLTHSTVPVVAVPSE